MASILGPARGQVNTLGRGLPVQGAASGFGNHLGARFDERGVYTPIVMERVRKRLKTKGLRASIMRKSAQVYESKGVE
jgi:hypothetical protein